MAMTMRERIAKRLFEECYPGATWEHTTELKQGQDDFRSLAEAVLAELETPTDGMVEAARRTWTRAFLKAEGTKTEGAKDAFAAAIRAAREGK